MADAVNAQNLILPSGTAKIGATEYNIEVNSSPRLLEQLNDLPLKTVNGATIYLRDVAQVRDGYQPQQNVVRQDGVRGALLTILKTGSASTLDVARDVKNTMPGIMNTLPPELEVKEFADQSLFVRHAVTDVAKEGVVAAAPPMARTTQLCPALLTSPPEVPLPRSLSTRLTTTSSKATRTWCSLPMRE